MDHDERRRFFRIDDVVAIHYEVMTDDEALEQQKSLRQERLGPRDRIMDSEKELQLLIDKLRTQNPEFARAIELLNIKFSILKDESPDRPGDLYGSNQIIQEVSISACGLSFGYETRIAAGRKMFLDVTLLPTDLGPDLGVQARRVPKQDVVRPKQYVRHVRGAQPGVLDDGT